MEKFFVSRPIFAISLAIVIVLVGLISIMGLPIEQYPDITPPVVEVSATYDGADAETVNNAVATPVAQSVMGVSDMLYLQTTSANDGSMVMQVTFDIGSDPDLDAIFTQNNVSSAAAQLPVTVTKQGVNSVWVVRPDSTAAYRRVVLGDTYGTMWCVDEGLAEGEQVVTAGQQKLRNGMKVIPVIR